MAIVSLKNVRVIGDFARGIRVVEESSSNGRTFKTRWTIWTDQRFPVGDLISVSGFLSAKADSYEKDGETKLSVDLSLNQPRFGVQEPQGAAETAPGYVETGSNVLGAQAGAQSHTSTDWATTQPAAGTWGGGSDDAPF